ncbi:hypothetical protein Tco_1077934 [Tanacetum coccineum]
MENSCSYHQQEDIQYQIDFRQSKLRRREIIPYPRFTKLIINHFISQHKSLAKLKYTYINTIKDDGVLNRLKFVITGEDFQEYGRAIPDTMLTEEIKQSEAYHTFLTLSTGLIPPKKTRGKGSKGKKPSVTPKKKSLISSDDNIILEPNVALELAKSISKTEAEIAEEERRLYETHERLVTTKPTRMYGSDESDGEPANRPTGRPSGHVEKEQLVVLDELTGKTSSEGAGIIPEVPDEVKGSSAAKADAKIDWGSKDDSNQSDEEYVNVDDITWISTDEEEKAKGDDDE